MGQRPQGLRRGTFLLLEGYPHGKNVYLPDGNPRGSRRGIAAQAWGLRRARHPRNHDYGGAVLVDEGKASSGGRTSEPRPISWWDRSASHPGWTRDTPTRRSPRRRTENTPCRPGTPRGSPRDQLGGPDKLSSRLAGFRAITARRRPPFGMSVHTIGGIFCRPPIVYK
jgi:hypothetical protein